MGAEAVTVAGAEEAAVVGDCIAAGAGAEAAAWDADAAMATTGAGTDGGMDGTAEGIAGGTTDGIAIPGTDALAADAAVVDATGGTTGLDAAPILPNSLIFFESSAALLEASLDARSLAIRSASACARMAPFESVSLSGAPAPGLLSSTLA